MEYTSHYDSPLGRMLLSADDDGLTGLWFEGQKYFARELSEDVADCETVAITKAKNWLDQYFDGYEPNVDVPLSFHGSDFQKEVWRFLCEIPYGKTVTYGYLADRIAKSKGLSKMSAQAVGGAVGHNKISIIVPCHRVVGANGSMTGYAGGISKKIELLKIEDAWEDGFFVPKKSTAP